MRAKEKPNATVIHTQNDKVTFVVLKNECIDMEIDDIAAHTRDFSRELSGFFNT